MRRVTSSITIIVAIIVLIGGILFYIRKNQEWQSDYQERVSTSLAQLLQTNPYDKNPVVIIVIDGLRWEEGIGGGDKYIPFIFNELVPKGTLFTNYYISSPTVTTSVHSAMLTGRISTVPNDGHIRPVFPTFFEMYRDARADFLNAKVAEIIAFESGLFSPNEETKKTVESLVNTAKEFSPEKTALYLGKDLIYSLDQSSCGLFPEKNIHLVHSLRDIEVLEYFRAKVPDVKPNLVLANLADTDEAGHEAEWHYYVQAIRDADSYVETMWNSLQELSRYKDKTHFIVTTDHGRHIPSRGGYPHHGDFCEGCQHSFILYIGPGINKGKTVEARYDETSLAPTIAKLMGFEMPASVGKPMDEIFENPGAVPASRHTEMCDRVADIKAKVDRDTPEILAKSLKEKGQVKPENSNGYALYLLAVIERAEQGRISSDEFSSVFNEAFQVFNGLSGDNRELLLYPFLKASVRLAESNPELSSKLRDAAIGSLDGQIYKSYASLGFLSAALVMAGKLSDDPALTIKAYDLILEKLGELEGKEKVYEQTFGDFLDDYRYREGPNELFGVQEISISEKIWVLWGLERVLDEDNPNHDVKKRALVERQFRLMCAFCNEWQDANAMVSGGGGLSDEPDFVSEGLVIAVFSDFKPWRKWELDELEYNKNIYATPLFDFPPFHMFYLLGQGNALAGAWAANERLQLFINDDGTICKNLVDRSQIMTQTDLQYSESAMALLYGLERFREADYEMFDLELYPIVHQK